MKTKKINLYIHGIEFKNIPVDDHPQSKMVPMGSVGMVARQYIKHQWPGVKFQISTESYSMGSSLNVFLSPVDVSNDLFDEIEQDLKDKFAEGSFNAMEDIYEHSQSNMRTFDGYEFGAKHVFVQHKPKYGTKKYEEYLEWIEKNESAS